MITFEETYLHRRQSIKSIFCIVFVAIGLILFCGPALAEEGIGNPKDANPSDCKSPNNTISKLCDSGSGSGSGGGGASWRIYRTAKEETKIDGVRGKKADGTLVEIIGETNINGCNNYGWYLRYGYEQITSYGKSPRQLGVASITGIGYNKKGWKEFDFASDMMYDSTILSKKKATPFYYNEYDAIEVSSGGKVDYESLMNKVGSLESDSGKGLKMKWGDVKFLFDIMKSHGEQQSKKYTMTKNDINAEKPGLGWFCFNPDNLIDEKKFHSISSVSVASPSGNKNEKTGRNENNKLVKINAKKGDSIKLGFEHFIEADFDPKTTNAGSEYKINKRYGSNSGSIDNLKFDQNSAWVGNGTGTYSFNAVKGIVNPDFLNDTIIADKNTKICHSIGSFYKKISSDGKIITTQKADEDNSKICVEITVTEDTPTGTCFRDGVIDASDDKGNNAIWSYVRNNNKSDGTGFPDPTAGHSDNSALSAGLRETEVVGGNKGVDNSTVSIFAKPLDRIQFRHVFCFGAQAVKSLSLKDAKAGKSRGYHTPESAFGLSGDNGPIYDRAISGGQISFKSGEDGKVKSPDSPVRSEQWGRAYDDSRSGGHSVEVDNTGNTISEKVTIGSNSKAWVGGSIERSFKWDKPLSDDKTEFTDGSDDEMHKGPPSACGCNATDNASKIIPSNVYGDLVDLDPVNGLEYKKCKQNGECDKKCKPLPPASGVPSSPPQYPRDCDREGNCKFNNFEEDKDNAYKLFPLNTSDGSSTTTTTTQVKVPYNFNTEMKSAPTFTGSGAHEDGGVVFAGEVVTPESELKVLPRKNPVVSEEIIYGDTSYATRTPKMKTKIIAFTILPDVDFSSAGLPKGNGIVDGTENQITGDISVSGATTVTVIDASSAAYNQFGNLKGTTGEPEKVNLGSITVPDVAVGTKLCVIAAVYPADSHGLPRQEDIPDDNDQALAMGDQIMNGKHWRLSPPACRTIAKKPSAQVWNGGIISGGSITGAPAHKIEGKLGENKIETVSGSPNRHSFGSWSEYELIAQGKISGFGSGAAMGYVSTATSRFALPGGIVVGPSDPFACAISKLTIANSPADKACDDSTAIGESGITIDATIRERLEGRYRNLAEKSSSDTIQQGYTCTYDSATNKYIDRDTSQTCANNGTRYFGNTNITINTGNISTPFILGATSDTSSNKNTNNTMVIDAENNVHIESNIYYENTDYKNIASIPQLLIFAKNIYISANVTNVDAWLIAENIYTCAEAHDGGNINNSISAAINDGSASGDSACGKQLRINGPVFVGSQANKGKLHLLRHAGAYPGGGSRKPGFNPANPVPDLLNDGSVTPAEIFNLRLDAYLWAYSQAERLTQAFVTYSRELPPRY